MRRASGAYAWTDNGTIIPATSLLAMRQHFDLQDGGTRLGTTLVSDMHKVGIKACIIMHTGNNLSTDVAIYKRAGAHGVVGREGQKSERHDSNDLQKFS